MTKSLDPKRKAVVDVADLLKPGPGTVCFFFIGAASIFTWGLLLPATIAPWKYCFGGTRGSKSIHTLIIACGFVATLLFFTYRLQSNLRKASMAALIGAAYGLGAVAVLALSVLLRLNLDEILNLMLFSIFWAGFFAVVNFLWAGFLNRIRPIKPMQDGTLCPQCAYSVVGNTSGVCPECGCNELPKKVEPKFNPRAFDEPNMAEIKRR